MTCKICKQLIIVPLNADMPTVYTAFDEHIRRYHPDQARELVHQAAAVMRWLSGRIFTLEGGAALAHADMTERMTKLAASIQLEIDQAKTDAASKLFGAAYPADHKPTPAMPLKRK